jgi:hypothetical protein
LDRQSDLCSPNQFPRATGKLAKPKFRPRQIKQDRDLLTHTLGQFPHMLHSARVFSVIAM